MPSPLHLLTAVVLRAFISAVIVGTTVKVDFPKWSDSVFASLRNQTSVPGARFLRSEVPTLPTSSIETLKSIVNPGIFKITPRTIKRWLAKKKSIDNAYVRLGLKRAKDDELLAHPEFLTRLAKLLEKGKSVSTTEGIAHKLQLEQFTRWADTGSSPTMMFNILRLNFEEDPLLRAAWMGYSKFFGEKYPKKLA